MWVMIIILYFTVVYIDSRAFATLKEKGVMPLYIMLMALSCLIGAISSYAADFPSPAGPIRNLVLTILGK